MAKYNMAKYRNQYKKTETQRGGTFWKPSKGRNIVRVFGYDHQVTELDLVLKRYGQGDGVKAGDKEKEFAVECHEYFLEDGKSPAVGPIPAIDIEVRALRRGDKKDKERAREMSPTVRFYMQIVDMQGDKKGVTRWAAPKTIFRAILEYLFDEEIDAEKLFGINGRDFIVNYDPDQQGTDMYSLRLRESDRCDELDKAMLKQAADLHADPRYMPGSNCPDEFAEEITEKVLDGHSLPDEQQVKKDDDDEGAKPSRKKSGGSKKSSGKKKKSGPKKQEDEKPEDAGGANPFQDEMPSNPEDMVGGIITWIYEDNEYTGTVTGVDNEGDLMVDDGSGEPDAWTIDPEDVKGFAPAA